jgi:hypothetical protein
MLFLCPLSLTQRPGLFRYCILLARLDYGFDTPDFVTQTDVEHGLLRILEQINNLARRSTQKKIGPIGKQVILGSGAHCGRQVRAKFLLQKSDYLPDPLERKITTAQLADDGDGNQFLPGINAAMALACGDNDAAFVPPLQLPGCDPGEIDYVAGCEFPLHLNAVLFKTKELLNV